MKIIDKEERDAHALYIAAEGVKGLFYGLILSLGVYGYLKMRHPIRFGQFNTSIKACILTMPTIAMGAFFADEGSVEFDRKMHSSNYTEKVIMEEYRAWKNMAMSDQIFMSLSNNKYKIIFSSWLASMYGSWVLVNRDKIMTSTQKLVQARMYAQAITIALLLSTVLLAMKEEELLKKQPEPVPEWRQILLEKEAKDLQKKAEAAETLAIRTEKLLMEGKEAKQ